MASRQAVPDRPRAAPSTARKRGRSDSPRSAPVETRSPEPSSYWALSNRPLHILAFLLPLLIAYELGSAIYLVSASDGTHRTIQAQRLLGQFFELFGAAGLFLPGIALLTVLLVWHVLLRDRWRIELPVLGGMFVESAGWTFPLLVLAAAHSRATAGMVVPAAAGQGVETLLSMPWQARLMISLGAGLYEEMLFRLLLIAFLHLIIADLAQVNKKLASVLCIVGSALAFALYHDTTLASGAGTDWGKLLFFTASGVYLGSVYVLRGFGIVVGAHALYDTLVLVFLPGR